MPHDRPVVRSLECAWAEMACATSDVAYHPDLDLILCREHAALVEQDERRREEAHR